MVDSGNTDTVLFTITAVGMEQNKMFTAENVDHGCAVNRQDYNDRFSGNGVFQEETQLDRNDTLYIPWLVADSIGGVAVRNGCVVVVPNRPTVSIESFNATRLNPTSSVYDFEAVFNNIDVSTKVFIRSQAGTPECTSPELIPEDSSEVGVRMARELKETGKTSTTFIPSEQFTITLLLFDEDDNYLDAKSICQDWNM